jgi:hypothetical protein
MSRRQSTVTKLVADVIFLILVTAIGVYVVASSFSLQPETRAFAIGTGVVLVILAASLLGREVARSMAQVRSGVEGPPAEVEKGTAPLLFALSWCVAFFVGVLLVGFVITIPFWVFFLLLWNRASRVMAVVIPILLWALVKFLLEYGLNTILFRGILFGDKLSTFW